MQQQQVIINIRTNVAYIPHGSKNDDLGVVIFSPKFRSRFMGNICKCKQFFGLFATHLFINSRSDMNLSGNDILVARVPSREGEVYDVRGFESDMSEAIMHAQVRIKLFS